jgi:hypothetical protein
MKKRYRIGDTIPKGAVPIEHGFDHEGYYILCDLKEVNPKDVWVIDLLSNKIHKKDVYEDDYNIGYKDGYSLGKTVCCSACPIHNSPPIGFGSDKKLHTACNALKEIKAMLQCQFFADGTTNGIKGHYMKTLINIASQAIIEIEGVKNDR